MKKKLIREKLCDFSIYDLDGKIDDVIGFLQEKKSIFEGQGFFNISVDVDSDIVFGESVSTLNGTRYETDEELKKRSKEARDQKKKDLEKELTKEQEEKELYESLKKKYEGVS